MYFRKNVSLAVVIVVLAVGAIAQVTGSGTTNQVAKFTGSTTIGNSAITEASGKVGIGTNSPAEEFDVHGNSADHNGIVVFNNTFTNNQGTLYLLKTGPSYVVTDQTSAGVIESYNDLILSAAKGAGVTAPFIRFQTGRTGTVGNTRMVIDNVGNVAIGTTSPQAVFHVRGNLSNDGSGGILLDASSTNPSIYSLSINPFVVASGQVGYQFKTVSSSGGTNIPLTFNHNGGIGIGTTSPKGGNGTITFADGTLQSTAWTGALCGGDYAESVNITGDRTQFEPGDVLVIDPNNPGRFLKSVEPYSALVSGIYSTKPGVVGRRQAVPKSDAEVPMAMIGIVPVKVSAENGPISVGDLLVTSAIPGYAMKGTDPGRLTGRVLGKALESLGSGTGTIEVLVTLQ